MNIWDTLRVIAEDIPPVGAARIAAAIVYKGEILSIGVCSYKTHPLQKKWGRNPDSIYLHAEIDAIRNALHKVKDEKTFKKSSIYIMRVKRPSSYATYFVTGLAKPCSGCMKAIKAVGIRNIYWSDNE